MGSGCRRRALGARVLPAVPFIVTALASCSTRSTTELPLPPLGDARALIVATTSEGRPLEAVAFDVDAAPTTLPRLRDAELDRGAFTVLTYASPLDGLGLPSGQLELSASGPYVDALPTPLAAFERSADDDSDWTRKGSLDQTALRASVVGLPRPCPVIEATWTPIEGSSGYVQAAAWLGPDTLLVATNDAWLFRVELATSRVVRLATSGQLVTALYAAPDGRVFAGTASTALAMEVTIDGDAARLTPLDGPRVPTGDALGTLVGPEPDASDVLGPAYGLSRLGRLAQVTFAPPTLTLLADLRLEDGSNGSGLVWVGPDRYLGYSNRAVGRVIELDRGVPRLRPLSLGAFSAIGAHPTLGVVIAAGLQAWRLAPTMGDARMLPELPPALVDVEAMAPVPSGLLFAGQDGLVTVYLTERDQLCAEVRVADSKISLLAPRTDGTSVAFTEAVPAANLPLTFGVLRVR